MSTTPASNGSSGRASVPNALPPSAGARARVSGASTPTSPATPGVYGSARPAAASGGGGGGVVPPRRPGGNEYPGRKKIRPRWGRIALVAGAAIVVLALLAGVGAYSYYRYVDAGLQRDDPFSQITDGRPAKVADGALNMLLLGSDSRDPDNKGKPGEWRTDTMIMLHIPSSHDKAYLVSMPRDLYVYIPKSKTTPYGDTKAKLNASFSWGGTPLTVQTIEKYSNVRMDHVLLIDFGGFKQVIDALGGIDMNIEQDITSIHPPKRKFKKGMNHLNGDEALDYARQRYQFPDGDFARMRHQQQMMKAILDKAVSSGTVSSPTKLNAFLKAITKAMTVDKDFSLADMALQFRSLRSDDLTFLVSPHDGSKKINGEDVVVPNEEKANALYTAMRTDKMADWAATNAPKPAASGSSQPSTKASTKK
ncbi:LCP family protein [Dactylosporangium siamense]|uniref:LCP family protein n=1 Tax=Dactylosporangium siamense TaxID=685454 RepID=UPI001943EAD9|nr:LCP family protein [Dactylosporangium siamense]